ncbi:hypothetical protein M378DRAFT_559937 [Amanita muscaria Koide BX008]|uniref:Uncharacterized protein n=1 Tax=Amanita muscaria (strain Koide BX008) TaxID=946122 RepID=A0A0C2WGW2_AMAMK|nr:hypothetical protein M378DRAFT_559937 [Amanita muscaria Koide BX008]
MRSKNPVVVMMESCAVSVLEDLTTRYHFPPTCQPPVPSPPLMDLHTSERSLKKKRISNERDHLLHHNYNLSTASLKKSEMRKAGKLVTENHLS